MSLWVPLIAAHPGHVPPRLELLAARGLEQGLNSPWVKAPQSNFASCRPCSYLRKAVLRQHIPNLLCVKGRVSGRFGTCCWTDWRGLCSKMEFLDRSKGQSDISPVATICPRMGARRRQSRSPGSSLGEHRLRLLGESEGSGRCHLRLCRRPAQYDVARCQSDG